MVTGGLSPWHLVLVPIGLVAAVVGLIAVPWARGIGKALEADAPRQVRRLASHRERFSRESSSPDPVRTRQGVTVKRPPRESVFAANACSDTSTDEVGSAARPGDI